MTYAGPAAEDAPGTRTGGLPLVPAGFEWPVCRTCQGNMQFLAQIALRDLDAEGYLAIFMCQNNRGTCSEWDPWLGGNQASLFPEAELSVATPPDSGVTRLGEVSAVSYVDYPDVGYDEARSQWASDHGGDSREVLGQLGGEPAWIQGDETPNCPVCGQPMRLVAQLEQGHNHETAANYGGGSAYAFACLTDQRGAFLWQQ